MHSSIVLSPKPRSMTSSLLSQLTPNCYSVQGYYQYLTAMAAEYIDVAKRTEMEQWLNVNPQRDNTERQSLLDDHLHQGKRKAIRCNRFEFFIHRQKRCSHFVQKIKNMAENREVTIWVGKGGDGPSRQRVKTPKSVF
ncbi:hypothetical protein P9112_004121 [Eukaryota sp. TZLM1-RC]